MADTGRADRVGARVVPPFLVGKRLYLRTVDEADLDGDYLRWLNDREVTRYLEVGKYPMTREALAAYVARFNGSSTDLLFAIVDAATGVHIGTVTLNRINWIHQLADTGILIGRKEYWGKGYGFEAWSLLIEYAFHRLGLRRIVAGTLDGNAGSVALLKKLGFTHEGTLRRQALVEGEFRDGLLFGLLREEFRRGPKETGMMSGAQGQGEGTPEAGRREEDRR